MSTSQFHTQFEELFHQHRDKVYRICYAYLYDKSQVDDLFQEVMINLWKSLPAFKGQAQLSTWMYRITVNTAITFNRKDKRKQDIFVDGYPQEPVYRPNEQLDKEASIQMLHQCIRQLPKSDRIIIGLVLEDVSYKEIAEVVGLSTSHVGVKINRIKKRISGMISSAK